MYALDSCWQAWQMECVIYDIPSTKSKINYEVVKLLLEHGAAATADISGEYGTPLDFALLRYEEFDNECWLEIMQMIKKAVKCNK